MIVVTEKKGGFFLNPAYYLLFIALFLILFVIRQKNRAIIAKKVIQNKKMKGNKEMFELAKNFLGKDCLVYAFDSGHQFSGIIKEVTEGALLLETATGPEVINLDFVIRIREYPKNKNGKKKSVVLD